jgi:hypothetical protein
MRVYSAGDEVTIDREGAFAPLTVNTSLITVLSYTDEIHIGFHDEASELSWIERFDNIFDENGTALGANYTDVLNAVTDLTGGSTPGGSISISSKTITITDGSSVTDTDIDWNKFINATYQFTNIGTEVPLSGTIDPDNVSSDDANLIDNNLNNLCYNDNSIGSANKGSVGIDTDGVGGVPTVEIVRVWWWSNSFIATNFKIQGSNNGTTWTDILTNLDSIGKQGTFTEHNLGGTNFRYYRVFTVTGLNTSFVVLSEMKAYEEGITEELDYTRNKGLALSNDGGKFKVENTSGVTQILTVYYID